MWWFIECNLYCKNAECTLISDSSLTDKGVIIIQDDVNSFGIAHGETLFNGYRNKNAPVTSNENLYNLDIKSLITNPHPGVINDLDNDLELSSAESIVNATNSNYIQGVNKYQLEINTFPANPTYSISDVRACRRLIIGWCNRSAFSLADTIENKAAKNIPTWLTPALSRVIVNERSNIPQLLSNVREINRGGTRIRPAEPGNTITLNDIGKFGPSTFEAMISCVSSLYVMVLAVQKFC